MKTRWFFEATKARGGKTQVTFPSRIGVPIHRVKYHAARLAEKQNKTLTNAEPRSFETPHLSFMGRHIITSRREHGERTAAHWSKTPTKPLAVTFSRRRCYGLTAIRGST